MLKNLIPLCLSIHSWVQLIPIIECLFERTVMQLSREKHNFHLTKIATSWVALEDVEKELEWLIDYALYWNFFFQLFLIFRNQFC